MDHLLHLDHQLFFLINQEGQNAFLDWLMPWWREKTTWIPLYVLLLIVAWLKTSPRYFLYFALAVALTVGLADTLSSKVVKPSVERLRPCNDQQVRPAMTLRVHCGPGYSFPSSHATNHFAIGVFLYLTLGLYFRRWRWLFLLWAASISYGQVYVGVHYPVDVLGGALLGAAIGGLTAWGLGRAWSATAPAA